MAQNYTVITIPGKSNLKIAVTDINTLDDIGVKSPEWMVKIDDDLESNVDSYDKYCELFGWYASYSRFTTGDIGNLLHTSATLKHSELILMIPNGGFSAKLESKMNLGIHLKEIQIVRLGNIKNVKVKLQTIDYTICRIQSMQQQLDRLFLYLNVTTRKNTINVYDAEGNNKGQVVSQVDYSKNTAE